MGQRRPDRTPGSEWRRSAETIGQMRERGWDVVSTCGLCHLAMRVDLDALITLRGAELSLWDRRSPCRRIGCEGLVTFSGRPPGCRLHKALRA